MCRIVGGLEFKGKRGLLDSIEKMRDYMSTGGPDDFGLYTQEYCNLALGHRRLSIIDLSGFSHQPFVSKDERFALVFNGEIYNYKEIANKLVSEGVRCEAFSDTEVLLQSFAHWGVECVKEFEGMFAFAIWDNLEQKLYCFRDRSGSKPLYYYFDGERFLFASELKGILSYPYLKKSINKESLSLFLSFGYIPAPHCILEYCFKLEAGSYLVVDKEANIVKGAYYHPKDFYLQPCDFTWDSFISALQTSIAYRMVSDVPVGVLLSGGVDSSLVCAVLKDLGYSFESFSMGFVESSFDESSYARQVADILGITNHQFICHLDEVRGLIEQLPFVYDEPFGDVSALPTMLLASKIAKTHKVALSADGGDELGIGYERYFWSMQRWKQYRYYRKFKVGWILDLFPADFIVDLFSKFGISMGIDKFLRIKNQLKAKSFLEHYKVEITHFKKEDLLLNHLPFKLIGEGYSCLDTYTQMSYFDWCHYLSEDILTKTDRASMHVGLEIREPLLGREFVRFMQGIPMKYKVCNGEGKIVFKKYLEKFFPHSLIYRSKMGFGVPLEAWMRGDLRYLLEEVLDYAEDYLDTLFINKLLSSFDANRRVDFSKIWYIYVFCAWRKQWNI
ncbi:asparagine synthase (glutamine-hydrolyzing) [Helicobacter apodemus]|uniref:asparagine synthase (glutamine-hydrolyzing) n=1 Tax=Helicobacter apodemus TaxID=135569 RepID=A0A2U8FDR2_9HELI|nr:asparagine synthase (glutamine-hydrolyzing) [Helicobacter apodemus]AWI33535.1 asparagine synthase (glutamine-hydrolyzing) [Helicobacter apodemus]